MKKVIAFLILVIIGVVALYATLVINWNYSSGERAGWVQKFSRKGWICKTWEGELAMISMPGTTQEKFFFTVWDESVAEQINRAMGQRVALHYEQKIGLISSCFGETSYWVDKVLTVPEIQLSPGVVVPIPPTPGVNQQAPQAPQTPQTQTPQTPPAPQAPAQPPMPPTAPASSMQTTPQPAPPPQQPGQLPTK